MYLSTVGILVITVIFLGLLFLFTPWLYRPYLDLLEAREALEDPTASPAGSEAVERLEQRVQAQWDEARQEVVNHASASSEEAELELTIASARTALRDDVAKLADELVSKALGRSA
jgi:F0F1-type ATP synthase membrane subunit b/b'